MATNTEEFRSKVAGRSDDEITSSFASVDSTLDEVFQGMVEAFLPEKAGDQAAVIQYDINTAAGVKSYQLDIADGECKLLKGADKAARVTLDLSYPDFLRLVTGNLDGMQAFMTGKLKLRGDMFFSQTIQGWFERAN